MKTRWYFILVIGLSVIPLISIFLSPLLPHTHDGLVHLPRMAAFYKALEDGQFPVRWAKDLNYGYGMPLFNFIYQLPYFISSVLIFFGTSLVDAFKGTIAISYIASGIFMFLFSREFFGDNKRAFIVTVFYQFFPFRFVELFVRGSLGEVYTYTFLPLVLYGLIRVLKKGKASDILLTIIASACLILSHNSVSLLFFGVCSIFVVWFGEDRKKVIYAFIALVGGLLLSLYYWFPAMYDHQYTYGNLYMKDLYKEHFAPLQNFFIPNFTNNAGLQTGGIAISIGLMQALALFVSAYLTFYQKEKKYKRIFLFSFVLLVGSFFFMQPVSSFLWEHIAFLRQFQFPWRFLSIVGFATALLSVGFVGLVKRNIFYYAVIGITIFSSVFYWHALLGVDTVKEDYYWNFPLNTTYYGETDLIWSQGPAKKYAEKEVQFAEGKGTVQDYSKSSTLHTFTVNADVLSKVVDNTQYFPGWKAYVDNSEVPIQFQDQNWRGVITFPVEKGTHSIKVIFEGTKIHKIANTVSFLTGFIILVLGGYLLKKRYG